MMVLSYQTYHVVATMMVSHTKKSPDLQTRIYLSQYIKVPCSSSRSCFIMMLF